jgi:uncharacterized membrane protein
LAHGSKRRNGEGEVTVLEKTKRNWASFAPLGFLIIASTAGLALVPALVQQHNLPQFESLMRYSLVGTLYLVICVLGLLAVFYPAKCTGMFQKTQNPLPQKNKRSVHIKGHHPDCQNYSANRIQIGGRAVCASCSGLLVGAVAVLIGDVWYFFVGFDVAWSSVWLLVLGEVLMLMGLAQIRFTGYAKLMVNLFFVVGSFVALVETDLLGTSLLVDFYALGLIVFMLWLRILLSDWNNRRICQMCQSCF